MQETGSTVQSAGKLSASLPLPVDQVIRRVKEAFKKEGFGVLSEIDVQKALREKTGEEIEPYIILGMCNPPLASRAIRAEHEVGVFLPCNVLIHACEGRVHIRAQDPALLFQLIGNVALQPVAEDVRGRIERALADLAQ